MGTKSITTAEKVDSLALILVFALFFSSLLASLALGFSLIYPLAFGLVVFVTLALVRGYPLPDLLAMLWQGSRQSLIVIQIFVMIGIITAVWRACGTISFIVYHGVGLINGQYFVLSAFLLSCGTSFLLGTSFGTAGTMGVILAVMARSGQVDIQVTAGAIIAGAYFGDRCSPLSSSAVLVAMLTRTRLYLNLANMLKSSLPAFLLSCAAYMALSLTHPLSMEGNPVVASMPKFFNLNPVVFTPAVVILGLAALKIDVKKSMGASILTGVAVALTVQQVAWFDLLTYVLGGYQLKSSATLAQVINGGGLYSMLSVSLIVLLSSAYSGLFAGTGMLQDVEMLYVRLSRKVGLYAGTVLTSLITAAFSCNQTLAVMLTHQLTNRVYENAGTDRYRLALDLENTVILLSAVIPWNIAGAVPAAALSADAGFIPYAFYLYFVPLTYFFTRKMKLKAAD